jgi:hypothetical protein
MEGGGQEGQSKLALYTNRVPVTELEIGNQRHLRG